MAPRKRNKILRGIKKIFETPIVLMQRSIKRLLRDLYLIINSPNSTTRNAKTGFVLPTVIMVILVVVLLTTAIVIRSLDRAKNANNYRVEQTLVNASTPALERARAKIDNLLNNDKTLPRGTPSDVSIRNALKGNKYVFGDETQLRLTYDGLSTPSEKIGITATSLGAATKTDKQEIVTKITEEEVIDTAWKFPYDSDNNGKFDSFVLYSIVYRNPPLNTGGATLTYSRKRTPLEARALPSADALNDCSTGGSENSLVSGSDWLKVGGKFKKAFYVYVANVPITSLTLGTSRSLDSSKYEPYNSNKSGFSGLEMSLEPSRIPLNNNAVWFDNDIEISYSSEFNINGRVHTNGNLMVSGNYGNKVHFYLVSALDSCHYKEPENSKITIGGEIGTGEVVESGDEGGVRIHLYRPDITTGVGNATTATTGIRGTTVIETTTGDVVNNAKTTTETGGNTMGYNSNAYAKRIGIMVDGAINLWSSSDARIPATVKTKASERQSNGEDQLVARRKELESFFKERTRRVPYKEVPYQHTTDAQALCKTATIPCAANNSYTSTPSDATNFVFGSGTGEIRPPIQWILPFVDNATTPTGPGGISTTGLNNRFYGTDKMYLQATNPEIINTSPDKKDNFLGDRLLVGNGLPKNWADYIGSTNTSQTQQFVKNASGSDIKWLKEDSTSSPKNRYRESKVEFLDDLGDLSRGGFWEQAAAKVLQGDDNPGGLRIVTGAGIYARNIPSSGNGSTYDGTLLDLDNNASFLPRPSTYYGTNVEGAVKIPCMPSALATATNQTSDSASCTAAPGQVAPFAPYKLVWSDQMPMSMPDNPSTTVNESTLAPDLRMRATAVYHYRYSQGQAQEPLACVSSYYDPSTATTALNGNYKKANPQVFPWDSTATDNLPYNNGTGGRSNNGVVYPNPYGSSGRQNYLNSNPGIVYELQQQSILMFPNGRLVNQALQNAIIKLTVSNTTGTPIVQGVDTLNMANYSAIDAAVCALRILTDAAAFQPLGTSTVAPSTVNHGAIKEAAFLNARQVKSLQQNITSGTYTNTQIEENRTDFNDRYNLPLEQRQPLEIRVTELSLGDITNSSGTVLARGLKSTPVTNVTGSAYNTTTYSSFATPGYQQNDEEFLLPNSGVIYVGRDDALMDLSAATIGGSGSDNTYNPSTTQLLQSRSDLKLDPTRRPNGVRIINGSDLSRKDFYRYAEKGLILATDLPLYIEGDFNLHVSPADGTTVRDEFTTALDTTWSNFYDRSGTGSNTLNPNFSCVKGQISTCTEGDRWRPATLLSDSTTLLTTNFRDGFRDEGDYDLRNNIGNAVVSKFYNNGFWFNNYVTSSPWVDTSTNYPKDFDTVTTGNQGSSYLTNGVTPIQLRVNYPEYIMEICRKIPVAQCTSTDWVVGYDRNGDGSLNSDEINIKLAQLGSVLIQSATGTGTSQGAGKSAGTDNILQNTEVNWSTAYTTNSNSKTPLQRLGAGTTARSALVEADRRFPRRLAFSRNTSYGGSALVFTTIGNNNAAKPMGVGCPLDTTGNNPENSGCEYPSSTTRTAGTHYGLTSDKALWFWSTTNITGIPSNNLSYDTSLPLYYISPDTGGTKLILPDTACFTATAVVDCANATNTSTTGMNLNLPTTDKASDYLYCFDSQSGPNGGQSKNYKVTSIGGTGTPACGTDPRTTIDNAAALLTSTTNFPATQSYANQNLSGNVTITADRQINVINFEGVNAAAGTKITISPGTQTDPIFIFRGGFTFNANSTAGGVQVQIDQNNPINPNNIFWAFDNSKRPAVSGDAPADKPYIFLGNMISVGTSLANDWNVANLKFTGRLLGFTAAPNNLQPASFSFTAISSDGQPLLVPMLQIHSPTGSPSATLSTVFAGSFRTASSPWVQSTTPSLARYNGIFVTGDTPSASIVTAAGSSSARPVCPYPTTSGNCPESNGGLYNFMRLLEYWRNTDNLTIRGSFIEARQSYYDTAAFIPTDLSELDASGTDSMSLFGYTVNASNQPTYLANNSNSLVVTKIGFAYPGGGGGFTPYYDAAARRWGYDVGLLYASPDLFSQRFTTPPTGEPNQSFRPVGRDDQWVQSLLCAAQMPNDANNRPSATGTTKTGYDDERSPTATPPIDVLAAYGTNYTFAVSKDQRPAKCPVCWGGTDSTGNPCP